jgi:hypothetical protein
VTLLPGHPARRGSQKLAASPVAVKSAPNVIW